MPTKKRALLLGLVGILAVSCSSSKTTTTTPQAKASTATATLKDFAVTLDPTSLAAGSVTFNITNSGPSVHEFVVFKTDLAADKMPLNKDGEVDEEGAGVTHIDEKEDIAANGSATLTFAAPAGNYVALCNLPGHYKSGMRTVFTTS